MVFFRTLLFLAALATGWTTVAAHDLWIQPSAFRVAPREPVLLDLRVGHEFAGEAVPRDGGRMRRFVAVAGDGSPRPIRGRHGAVPAGKVEFDRPGFQIIGYRTHPLMSILDAEKFESYLKEEGLEHVMEVRKANGQSAAPGREWYSRCAKSVIVVAGDPAALRSGFDRALGLRLELIPETNPATLAPGGDMSLRLLFEGKPQAGVLVRATHQASPYEQSTARTDAHGRTRFMLREAGAWLFTAVHIIPAGDDHWSDGRAVLRPPHHADWESLWASLSLEVPPAAGAGGIRHSALPDR